MSLRFCGCTLDVDAHRLFRGSLELHLSPKAFETLRVLIENRPRALSKTDLLGRIWPDVIVSEVSLAHAISEIRQQIGDDRQGRIIRTVHSYGYAFAADVHDSAHAPSEEAGHALCWLISATRTIRLREGIQVIGRHPAADFLIDSPKVSRLHARIGVTGTQATIEDLGSTNGTFVGHDRIAGPTPLRDGDEVGLGRLTFTFRVMEPGEATEADG